MNNTIIQISRSAYVEKDRSIAVLRLDQHNFEVGEPVIVRYTNEQGETDSILAIGIRKGPGKDCYRVMSLGGLDLIRDVVYTLPDVSSLVHGELYLYQDPATEIWNYVYELGGKRQIEPIKSADTVFVNISDRYKWYWRDGKLKREDDFTTTAEMDSFVEEIFSFVNPPVLKAECLEGVLFEAGTKENLTLHITVTNREGKDITKDCVIQVDGKNVKLDNNNCLKCNDQSVNHDFVINATYLISGEPLVLETVVKVRFGYKIYWGPVAKNWTPTAVNVRALKYCELHARENINWTNITLDAQKTVFATPKAYGLLTHIYDDNGLCYLPDYTITEVTLPESGVTYYVYVKIEEVKTTELQQRFIYASEDTTEEIQLLPYDEIIAAWKRQNMANGLVVIGLDGKIPSELVPKDEWAGAGFIPLIGFVTAYPQYGIRPGQMWYNTVTKKIFRGTGGDVGIVEDPEEDKIYLDLSNKTMHTWRNSEMINIGGSVMSEKINNAKEIL